LSPRQFSAGGELLIGIRARRFGGQDFNLNESIADLQPGFGEMLAGFQATVVASVTRPM